MEKSRALTLRSLKISKEKYGGVHMHATSVSLPIEWPFETIEGAFRAGKTASTKTFGKQPYVAAGKSVDADLLDQIAEGDKAAMQVLFARYSRRVRHFVLKLVRDEALAEDLTNEVFVEVWRSAHRFKGNSQVLTWILSIARFRTISSLRRCRDDELDDAAAAALPDPADDPEIAVQKKDRVAILRKCMSHLSRAHREVIHLAYYQDKSVGELAEILGVPTNTVRTRMFNARKRMSKLLQEVGVDRTYQ
jgi:RNA polymerase sigma-70 factor, ECF subfamily